MPYIFRGHLCGFLCEGSKRHEDIDNAIIRLYRVPMNQDTLNRVVARPGEAIAPLSQEQVKEKAGRLLAEGHTNEEGQFKLAIKDNADYNGEAFEIDVYLQRAPGQQRDAEEPLQVTLATLQPRWRQTENDFIAAWEFCIPQSIWCAIRRRLDAWVIFGRLTVCQLEDENGNPIPVPDYTVSAFDNDWIQDDPLGDAVTDSNGYFRIDYTSADFTRTPLTPIIGLRYESFGTAGPDVYFQVRRNSDNALIIDEPQERALMSDRVNRQPCWCVDLCVDIGGPNPLDYPFFTQVGVFKLPVDLYDSGGQIGRTNKSILGLGGDGWGFQGNLRLVGLMPQRHPDNNQPMKYRFVFGETDTPSTPMTTANFVQPIQIGSIFNGFSTGPGGVLIPNFESVGVVPSGTTTDFDHNLVPDGNGWVEVPQHANFSPNHDLMKFRTAAVAVPGGSPSSVNAGEAVPPANQETGTLLYIRLQATDVAESAMMYQSAAYPVYVNNWREIGAVDLGELAGDPCSEVTGTDINIRFTTDHEFMRAWSLSITSSASPWTVPTLPSSTTPNPAPPSSPAPTTSPRGVHGSYVVDTAAWPSCTYRIILNTSLALTDGDHNDPSNNIDDVMFYIQS